MKKIILCAMFIGSSLMSFAQKPTAGAITSELNLNLTGASTISLNSPTGGVKFRYFISDGLAARVTLALGMSTTRTGIAPPTPALVTDPVLPGGEAEVKNSSWGLFLGVEKHFAGTDKLSPYVGAEIGLGGGSTTDTYTNSLNGNTYTANRNVEMKSGYSNFGVNVVTGADYYVAEHLYMGAEFGFGFMSINDKAQTTAYSGSATPPAIVTPPDVPAAKSSAMGFYPVGGIRLGIMF